MWGSASGDFALPSGSEQCDRRRGTDISSLDRLRTVSGRVCSPSRALAQAARPVVRMKNIPEVRPSNENPSCFHRCRHRGRAVVQRGVGSVNHTVRHALTAARPRLFRTSSVSPGSAWIPGATGLPTSSAGLSTGRTGLPQHSRSQADGPRAPGCAVLSSGWPADAVRQDADTRPASRLVGAGR